ncbi:hypothetical protein SLA2020_465380 [Shorea laevis]
MALFSLGVEGEKENTKWKSPSLPTLVWLVNLSKPGNGMDRLTQGQVEFGAIRLDEIEAQEFPFSLKEIYGGLFV